MATTSAIAVFAAPGPATVLSVSAGSVSSVARGPIAVLDVPDGGDGAPLRVLAVADWAYPLTSQPVLQAQERSFVLPATAAVHFVLNVGPLTREQLERLVALLRSSAMVRAGVGLAAGGAGAGALVDAPTAVASDATAAAPAASTSLSSLAYAGGSAVATAATAVAASVGSAVASLLSSASAPGSAPAPVASSQAPAPPTTAAALPPLAPTAAAAGGVPAVGAVGADAGGGTAPPSASTIATVGAVVSTTIVLTGKVVVTAAVVGADLAGRGVRWGADTWKAYSAGPAAPGGSATEPGDPTLDNGAATTAATAAAGAGSAAAAGTGSAAAASLPPSLGAAATALAAAKWATGIAVEVSKALVAGAAATAHSLGSSLTHALADTEAGKSLVAAGETETGRVAKNVAATTLVTAEDVWEGLEQAAIVFAAHAAGVTTDLVVHHYGAGARHVAEASMDVAADLGRVAMNARKTTTTALLRGAMMHGAKEAVGAGADVDGSDGDSDGDGDGSKRAAAAADGAGDTSASAPAAAAATPMVPGTHMPLPAPLPATIDRHAAALTATLDAMVAARLAPSLAASAQGGGAGAAAKR